MSAPLQPRPSGAPPKVLFVHNGAPGRFAPLAAALHARGWQMALINGPTGTDIAGALNLRFPLAQPRVRSSWTQGQRAEQALLMGRGAATAAERLKAAGFVPDLIVGHPGWGEMIYLAEVFPAAPQIQLGEYWYHSEGADANFDPAFPARLLDSRITTVSQNLPFALSYPHAAAIVAPTRFQAGLIPACFQSRVHVIHEGVDTAAVGPSPRAPQDRRLRLGEGTGQGEAPLLDGALLDGRLLDRSRPVISFANRRFEPMRGVHVFMRMLPRLFELDGDVHVLMIGADDPGIYGLAPPGGQTWLQALLAELSGRLDPARLHILPPLTHAELHRVFSAVTAHVYLTYPFVLSWSLLEAMACEALVVGSDTAPVRDAIRPGVNGLLVDFFDGEGLAQTLAGICGAPARFDRLRRAARETVLRDFDRAGVCEPAWLDLVEAVSGVRVG